MRDLGYNLLSTGDFAAPADDTAAEVEYAASVNGNVHAVHQIFAAYDAATTGELQITDADDNVLWQVALPDEGPHTFYFPKPVGLLPGQGLKVVLSAGGAGIAGTLSVVHELIRP